MTDLAATLTDQGIRLRNYGAGGQIRRCRTCKKLRSLECFWGQNSKKDGLQSECRFCMKERNLRWHRQNRDRSRQLNRKAIRKMRTKDVRKALWKACKDRAKQSDIEFDLVPEDIVIPLQCPVFGIKLESHLGKGLSRSLTIRDKAPSIDRIDNAKGYTKDNIIIVSFRANRIKSDASIEELKKLTSFYEAIHEH